MYNSTCIYSWHKVLSEVKMVLMLNFLQFVHQKPTQNKMFIGVTLPSFQCKYPNSKGYTNLTVHLVPN